MSQVKLSIIIPTFNRKHILLQTLSSLANQTVSSRDVEIIVVDDGSMDGSSEAAREFLRKEFPRWIVLEGPNQGPAHARNRGILASSAPLLLLLGDDMIPARDLLEEHFSWNENYPQDHHSILGYVLWHPELQLTPIMQWIDREDLQFGFRKIHHGQCVDYRHFYTCNISLKRRFLMNHPLFDTDFSFAAYEDIELGYRLQQRGLQIYHNRKAITYHHHRMTVKSFCRRMVRVGESETILRRKIPELGETKIPRRKRRRQVHYFLLFLGYHSMRWLPLPAGRTLRADYFATCIQRAFVRGLRRGMNQATGQRLQGETSS